MSDRAFRRVRRSPLDRSIVHRSWLAGHDGQTATGPVESCIWVGDPALGATKRRVLVEFRSSISDGLALMLLGVGVVTVPVLMQEPSLWWSLAVLAVLVTIWAVASRTCARYVRSVGSGAPGYDDVSQVIDTMEGLALGGYRVPLAQLVWDAAADPVQARDIRTRVDALAVLAHDYATIAAPDEPPAKTETESSRLLAAVTEALEGDAGTPA